MTHDNVTDIVERLQFFAPYVTRPQTAKMMTEAAEEIISLRKQLENAREAEREYKRIFAEMTRAKALKGPQ